MSGMGGGTGKGRLSQEEIWSEANKLLRKMRSMPMSRFDLHESIFLTNKVRWVGGELNTVAAFTESDLEYLCALLNRHFDMDD